MPIDEQLAERIRDALMDVGEWTEVKMFGGIGFMLNGHLLAGASSRGLLLRVGQERTRAALAKPGTRPLVMHGRTMKDYIYVDHPALNARAVKSWIRLAVSFVGTLPAKKKRKRK
ncbi:MAG TPA: TfoX/Sxy family protein [Gemmatimonadaceae bacterium]|nr:TfoX/Sxy family protein [Gemmatimonadaceae bacterium]